MMFTPEEATMEYVQDMAKVVNLTTEQRHLLCDLGFFNKVIEGYLIAALQGSGYAAEDIEKATEGLWKAFDELSAADAEKLSGQHR